MTKIPVAIIDKHEENIRKISSLLENISELQIAGKSKSVNELEILLQEASPVLALLGPGYRLEDIEDILKTYNSSLSMVKVILIAHDPSASLLRKAIKLNIHDVMEFPFTYEELKESIGRAEDIFNHSIKEKKDKEIKGDRKKIMVYSNKGGSGKSFIATNLAIALQRETQKEVVIFDLNYQFGDVALMLNLYPRHTVFDIMSVIDQLDPDMLKSFLTPHTSGVKVLPAPIDPSQDESISTSSTKKILKLLSEICDYLVIDGPSIFSDNILSVLDQTDYLCMVTSMDVPSIKNLKISLQVLEQLKFDPEKIILVLNRAGSKVGITLDEIEKTIERKIDIAIPSDRAVPLAVNRGVPLVTEMPRSAVSKSINRLAKTLLNIKDVEKKKVYR